MGSDLDWTDADFLKAFNELKNVVGNCLNRTIKMIDRYRAGVLPAPGDLEQIDRDLLSHGDDLPARLAAAYDGVDLQQCAELPVQLARLTNGYIDATEPFKLAKDSASQAAGHGAEYGGEVDLSMLGGIASDPAGKGGRGIGAVENSN